MRDVCIIGGGPAGILTIVKLLSFESCLPVTSSSQDQGQCLRQYRRIDGRKIIWIDPYFEGGRIGAYYRTVESNDIVRDWIEVLESYPMLRGYTKYLQDLDLDSNQELQVIVQVLERITRDLLRRVRGVEDTVISIEKKRHHFMIHLKKHRSYRCQSVVLATGSHPSCPLNHRRVIPLDRALNESLLKSIVKPIDRVCVVGTGQSAVLLLKYLSEIGVEDVTSVQNTTVEELINSLKAGTRKWAQEHLCQYCHRINILAPGQEDPDDYDRIIYATGFDRNKLPTVNVELNLDDEDGILAPGIFGIGIAFPEYTIDLNGKRRRRVGLLSFSRTLEKRLPSWFPCS